MPPGDAAVSQAVLIGVSRYPAMAEDRQLPAAARNLDRLDALLGDERVWGLPPENRTVVREPADAEEVLAPIRRAAAKVDGGTLLVYYAGHGLTEPLLDGGALHLALPGAYEPHGTHEALDYGHVRATLLGYAAHVPRKVVVLDCCWSGLAIPGAMGGASDGTAFAEAARIEGTAVLTACAANRQAQSPPGETYTAFTGELARLLDEGLSGGPGMLDVATLHAQVGLRLRGRGLPAPQLGCTGGGGGIAFARNVAAGPPPSPPPEHARAPEPPATARVSGAELRRRRQEWQRTGAYEQADRLLWSDAEAGDPESVRELALALRRSGRYQAAADLERAAPGTLASLVRRLHASGVA